MDEVIIGDLGFLPAVSQYGFSCIAALITFGGIFSGQNQLDWSWGSALVTNTSLFAGYFIATLKNNNMIIAS